MKEKSVIVILTGIILVLAAGLIGALLYIRNQPSTARGVLPIVEIEPLETDSSRWGINFPKEYTTFLQTKDNQEKTAYGGSIPYSKLEKDPRLVKLFSGYGFSIDYNEEGGHGNALTDVNATKRVNEKTPGTCYSCKSADNPKLWSEMGMAEYDKTPFSELGKHIDDTIGCVNCHEAGTMNLVVTNPALDEALKKQGKDWRTFTRQEMRTVVCANCHVEYYFAGEGKYLTFPWENGTRIDDIVSYYDDIHFKDWDHQEAKTETLKMQHPEFEFYTMDSTHAKAGVACADCHMPYTRDGAAKYTNHNIKSPLLSAEASCGTCHTDVEYVKSRVKIIQDSVWETMAATEESLVAAIAAIQAASEMPGVEADMLSEARLLHRHAQAYWDFIAAENSMGFHNPEEALRVLAKATDLARQAELKAYQAARGNTLKTSMIQETR